jgi:hypothetical protein
MRGAAEYLIKGSSHYINEKGERVELDTNYKENILNKNVKEL